MRRAARGHILMLLMLLLSATSLWIAQAAEARLTRLRAARASAQARALNALARSGLEIGAARLEGAAPVALAPRVYQIGEARLRVEGFAEAPQRLRACAHRAEAEVCLDAHAQGGLLLKIWRP